MREDCKSVDTVSQLMGSTFPLFAQTSSVPVRDDLEIWRKSLQLVAPVVQGGRWRHDDKGPPNVFMLDKVVRRKSRTCATFCPINFFLLHWLNHHHSTHLRQMCQQRNALYSLAQTHFVRQNAIDALLKEVGQPAAIFQEKSQDGVKAPLGLGSSHTIEHRRLTASL